MTVLFILPKTVSLQKQALLLYYLYCLCKSLQRSLLLCRLSFQESGCKGKNFQAYLPNIFGSFFHLSFFPSSLLRKGEQRKGCFTDPDSRKSVNQRCLLFESGCKGKNFISYLPNVSGSFFSFCFFKGEFQKETSPKQKKYVRVPTPFLSECQYIAAPVLESGCKSRTL